MKKIYIAHSVTNGCQDVRPINALAANLRKRGYRIVRPKRVLFPDRLGKEAIKAIETSDVIVADVSRYSHGVGFEIGFSYARNKRILVVCEQSARDKLSKVLVGLFPTVLFYEDELDLTAKVIRELDELRTG